MLCNLSGGQPIAETFGKDLFCKCTCEHDHVEGAALVALKKSKLPLHQVMLGERKGGWGRSIQGVVKAVSRLNKGDDQKAYANELQGYLELLEYCKKLWPDAIMDLTDEMLEVIISAFEKNQVEFADPVQMLLIQRRALNLMSAGKVANDTTVVKEVFEVLVPMLHDDEKAEPFNPRKPRMRDVRSVAEATRWNKASSIFTKRLMVPNIAVGAEASAIVKACAEVTAERLSTVDYLELEGKAAEVCTDWLDSAKGLIAIVGSVEDFLKNREEFEALDSSSSQGQSIACVIKGALGTSQYYSAIVARRKAQATTLMTVWPRIKAAKDDLESSSDLSSSLASASQLLVQFADNIDADALAPLQTCIKSKCQEMLNKVKDTDAEGMTSSDDECDGSDSMVSKFSKALHEVSLAFPSEAWVHDMNAEVGSLLSAQATIDFSKKFLGIMAKLKKELQNAATAPPTATVGELTKVLKEATPQLHFKGDDCKSGIKDCLEAFFARISGRCSSAWLDTAQALLEVLPYSSAGKANFPLDCVVSVIGLGSAMKLVTELSALLHESTWKSVVAGLVRAKDALKAEIKKSYSLQPKVSEEGEPKNTVGCEELDSICDTFLASADEALAQVRNTAKELFETKIGEQEMSVNDLASGSRHGDGWLAGKALSEWDSWDELLAQYHRTLHSLKPGHFKTLLTDSDNMVNEVVEINGLFGDGFLNLDGLKAAVGNLALTRSIGKIMRWLEKGDKDPDGLRSDVRAELLDLRKRLGTDWDYKKAMPKALANEMGLILVGKRKAK